jgi:hypothetical protein
LFNDTITPIDIAKENFSNLIGVPSSKLNNIEYSFRSYYSKKAADGRIFKSGNRFGFFEPMSATSMYMYSKLNALYEQHILASESNNPFGLVHTNDEANKLAKRLQDLICFFYHGGSKYNTAFWKMAKQNCSEHLNSSGLIEYLKESLTEPVRNGNPFSPNLNVVYSARSHVHFDRLFEHYYFTDPIK